jgi:hypothetical protein
MKSNTQKLCGLTLLGLAFVTPALHGQGVVINEIMFHSRLHRAREQYIELHNPGPNDVNVSGWRFTKGVSFTFPPATIIPASNYLVVAGDAQGFASKYPAVTNYVAGFVVVRSNIVAGFVYTNFESTLSHSSETLQLEDAAGQTVDSVTYAEEGEWAVRQRGWPDYGYTGWTWSKEADGNGKSLELRNPAMPNDLGHNWSPSIVSNGTPGVRNSVATNNVAPLISAVRHSPIIPLSSDIVTITARVIDEAPDPTVRLFWRTNTPSPGAFASALMLDDGTQGDGAAGDGVFAAQIASKAHGTIIEFYVEAVDVLNRTNAWPRPAINTNGVSLGRAVNALFQFDAVGPTNNAPYYKLVMTRAEYTELGNTLNNAPESDAAYNCTFISIDGQGVDVRYQCAVRNRGHGSRTGVPHNYHVGFPSDSPWRGATSLQINARGVHSQVFGAMLALRSQVAGNTSRAIQWRINGDAGPGGVPTYTYFAANESLDADYAQHRYPLDSGGNIYKVYRDLSPNGMTWRGSNYTAYTNTYYKASNTAENDFLDIVALHRVLPTNNLTGPNLYSEANVRAVLNVEQWLAHLAFMTLCDNQESGLNLGYNDDYSFYRGINDPRLQLVYHDLDSLCSWRDGVTNSTIFGCTANNGVGPAMTRLVRAPWFEPLYYQTLQRMIDTSFAKTNFDSLLVQSIGWWAPANQITNFSRWMDGRRGHVQALINTYFATNPLPPTATITGEPRSPTPLTNFVLTVGGSNVVSYRFRLNDGPWSAETPVATPVFLAGLPEGSTNVVTVAGKSAAGKWQHGTNSPTVSKTWVVAAYAPSVRLNEVLAINNAAFNHAGTFPDAIELFNEGASSVDIGGFRLSDDPSVPDKFIFPSPTHIPAGGYLVVFANNPDPTPGLHLGFTLDGDGETLTLYNSNNVPVDAVTFGLQLADLSVGRFGTAGLWKLCTPSLGSANVARTMGALSSLRINEWLASGAPPYIEDFIEFYNSASAPVDFGDCTITDNAMGDPALQRFPPLTFIGPGAFLKFNADGQDGPRHVDFSLSTDGDEITLLDPAGRWVDSVIFGPQLPGVSHGRCADGAATLAYLSLPTPGAPNACVSAPGLRLNEVLADNQTRFEPDGSTPSWIELVNTGSTNLVLDDLSLSDSLTNPRRFVFPAGTSLAPGAWLRVLCDSDRPASATNTGFGLKANGDSLHLFNNLAFGGGVLDSISFGVQAADFSIGRVPDGGTNWQLCVPTPSTANVASLLGDPMQLKINEWLANPSSGDDLFELFNPGTQPVALAELWLSDDLSSPATRMKHRLARLSFIGTNAFAFQKFSADANPQNGPDHVSFSLAAGGESLGISWTNGALIDGVSFGAQAAGVSQGRFTDGATNIVSFPVSQSLGDMNWLPLTSLVINEVLTHSDTPLEDAIELLNTNSAPAGISGWFLSDAKNDLRKYQITNAPPVPPGAFAVFYETQFNAAALAPKNFGLNGAHGDEVYLSEATNGVLTGYRAAVSFGAAANGVSFGRHRTSVGAVDFVALSQRTFGADAPATVEAFRTGAGQGNAYPLVGPVVLSEIMFHPPDAGTNDNSRDEFIELRNITGTNVALYDPANPANCWRIRGGVDFDFPSGASIAAGASLVVVGFDPVNDPAAVSGFKAAYGITGEVTFFGPWNGKLDNSGERIELRRPDAPQLPPAADAGFIPYIVVDALAYSDLAPWPTNADGSGQSLHRVSLAGYANDPTNWLAAVPSPQPLDDPGGDTDGDGMPNAWEQAHGLNPLDGGDASVDADADGMTNLSEYLAGTDPHDTLDVLRVRLSVPGAGVVRLEFGAASNRSYTVQFRASLGSGAWLPVTNISALPVHRNLLLTNAPGGPEGFYRIITPAVP